MSYRPSTTVAQTFICLILLAAAAAPALAGSMPLAWDANTDSDLAQYKIYYGTSSGSYTQSVSVGKVTSYTLTGLTDCTKYYVTIKAVDTAGNESSGFSNEIAGLPTPVVSSLAPASAEQGQALTVTITGTNFGSGASVRVGDASITVSPATVVSCTQVRAPISIRSTATVSAKDIEVVNADLSYGIKSAAFQVVATTPPVVASTAPADGAASVAISVHPSITFTKSMDPTSISSSTIKLLKSDGSAVSQASGSPALDASGTVITILPASSLGYRTTYKVQIVGGAGGVRAVSGLPLTSTFTQAQGFTTAPAPDAQSPTIVSTSPADGATVVAVSAPAAVTFSEAVDSATVTAATVLLLKPDGTSVPLAAGSPALDATHRIATITPAGPLAEKTTYRIQVVGGSSGVKDAAGNALAATFTQATGFTTQAVPPSNVHNLYRTDTH